MMIGTALFNVRQTGLEKQQAVQEKLSQLAVYREGINAHLTAAIALAERSPGGLMMPNQSLLYTGRVHACANLPAMMHIARELCGFVWEIGLQVERERLANSVTRRAA